MPVLTIRNVSHETLCALRIRAARNARSVAAEARAIIDEAVRPEERLGIGSELAVLGSQFGGIKALNRTDENWAPAFSPSPTRYTKSLARPHSFAKAFQ